MIACPSCSADIDETSRFCPSCGASLDASSDRATATIRKAPAGQAAAAPSTSSDSIDHARFTPGTMLTDRYRIVGLLGKGGMGEVYRADDLKLRQSVALKFLPAALSKDTGRLERFHHEVRVARQVSHPNVCRVYDIGEADGQHFISMEFVDGEDLSSLLRRIGKPSTEKAVEIARQLCAGLAAAHDKGVLHRDLKPQNVMIDGRGKVRVTDFGLAGFVEDFGGDFGAGTPAYMAPEQIAGREVSVKSDIYSLGLVLFELFTGKRLFEGTTREQVERLRSTTSASVSAVTEGIDPAVERVIQRCLGLEPAGRPSSALAVAAALPGADPLAAALAAGETPSPELVAVAGESGSLSMRTGLILLGSFLGVLVLYAGLVTYSSRAAGAAQFKAPIVLAENARGLLRSLGYADPPSDSAYGLSYTGGANKSVFRFWYRESRSRLVPHVPSGVVTRTDPAPTEAGMAGVIFDRKGKLLELTVVASRAERGAAKVNEDEIRAGFDPAFQAAGLDRQVMKPVPPTGTPTVGCDRLFAWEDKAGEAGGEAVHVEAGSLYGQPVYFELRPSRPRGFDSPGGQAVTGWTSTILGAIVPAMLVGIMIGCVFIARRNLRLGRGDRHGATRLGLAAFVAMVVSLFLVAEHWGAGAKAHFTLVHLLGVGIFGGVYVLTLYLAVEPYVRRAWPERIVSMTRLLSGRPMDPLIGRDLLIGLLIGMSADFAFMTILLFARAMDLPFGHYWPEDFANARLSMRHTLAAMGVALAEGMQVALWVLFLLVVALAVLRRRHLATAGVVAALFIWVCGWPRGGHIVTVVLVGIVWTAYNSVAILRFGLLTLMSAAFAHRVASYFRPTFDLGVWDVGNIWFANMVLIGLAVFGFVTATRGQTLLREEVFDSAASRTS